MNLLLLSFPALFLESALAEAEKPPFYELTRPGNRLCYYTLGVDGSEQPCFVYVPLNYDPSRPAPLVLSLHGFGGRTSWAANSVFRQNWADSHGWILADLDGRGSQNWDGTGEDDIFNVIQDLQETTPYHPALNIDKKRIYLEGCSMGGHGAFREGFRFPDTFAAVAPGAGWTTYTEFYAHWYDAADTPRMPEYVDPARLPVLQTASSVFQAVNARWLWTFISFDRNDLVNPPENQDPVIETLQAIGSDRFLSRIGQSGHCGSYCSICNFQFFLGKSVAERPPYVTYTSNDLRYNGAYWVTMERLRTRNRWGTIDARVDGQTIRFTTRNLLAFTLALAKSPLSQADRVRVEIDGLDPLDCDAKPVLRFKAKLNRYHETEGWALDDPDDVPSKPMKRPGFAGPIGDAFRSHFLVIFGTRNGTLRADVANPDWVAAQRFATDWNNWVSLHWGRERPPAERASNWWIPPYPFSPGSNVPERQPLVMPLPDTRFGLDTLPKDANLVLFGDVDTNWLVAQAADRLPLGLSSGEIRVRERVYRGENVNYVFVAPSPFEKWPIPKRKRKFITRLSRAIFGETQAAPEPPPAGHAWGSTQQPHYVVVSRGYLSSNIDPTRYGAGRVGKDIEALPFYWPDYVVWDRDKAPAATVQPPFKYLPETFLDAGYFAEDWQLDTSPPVSHLKVVQEPDTNGTSKRMTKFSITAQDQPGEFGLNAIQWRVVEGNWNTYTGPVELPQRRRVALEVRAVDNCGQFLYDPSRSPNRGIPAPGNMENTRLFIVDALKGEIQ